MESLSKLFTTEQAKLATKALDYLDGQQYQYVVRMLNEPNTGRTNWKQKGMRPRYRNVTRKIVEKSSQLFNYDAPEILLMAGETPDDNQTAIMNNILDDADFHSFLANLDQATRLLKTTLVLTQINTEASQLVFDILHRGNAFVWFDPVSRQPVKLCYKLDIEDDDYDYFTVWTDESIEQWREKVSVYGAEGKPEKVSEEPNVYRTIPVSVFYDTNLPRTGFWNPVGRDLIDFNDAYNMHLVDMDFAASWSVNQTLFTNAELGGDSIPNIEVEEVAPKPLPRQTANPSTNSVMGLAKIIHIDTSHMDEPVYLEFKGPQVDFTGPTQMFNTWVRDYAADWSVRVKLSGEAQAQSGFQLVVEEIDNLELRRLRSRMCERGLMDLIYNVMRVWNTAIADVFNEDYKVNIEIPDANLPINKKEQEEVWSLRIAEGRASRLDYFMEVKGMTKAEAEAKIAEIDEANVVEVELPTFAEV